MDAEEAEYWFLQAAELDNSYAMYSLYKLYKNGSKLNSYRESFKGVHFTENSRMTLSLEHGLTNGLRVHGGYAKTKHAQGLSACHMDYIKPPLGGKQIYAVTTADVQKMYNALKKNGKLSVGADGEKGLSGSTVRSWQSRQDFGAVNCADLCGRILRATAERLK